MRAFQTAARNRAYFSFLCRLERLWLRSRALGACAALGFRFPPLSGGPGLWFPPPHPCLARAQEPGELPRRRWEPNALSLSFLASFGSGKPQPKRFREEEWRTDWLVAGPQLLGEERGQEWPRCSLLRFPSQRTSLLISRCRLYETLARCGFQK